jgi:Flavin reductase like domain
MTMTLRQIPTEVEELTTFKQAMRHLIGGVSVITTGSGETRTGLTVTSAVSLSLDPPTMLVCVNRDASASSASATIASTSSTRATRISRTGSPGAAGLTGRLATKARDGANSPRARGASRTRSRWLIALLRKSSNAIATGSSLAPLNGFTSAAGARL